LHPSTTSATQTWWAMNINYESLLFQSWIHLSYVLNFKRLIV
jgi:hypothetical protein